MTACSLQAAAVGEPLAGTAPVARTWIVVEQPGPWGRDAVRDSDLPAPVREALLAAKAMGIGVLLARHPERSPRAGVEGHHVWVARGAAGGVRLRRALLPSLDPIAHWDLPALAEGQLPGIGSAESAPLLLVCTHSRRDQCCAVQGRALIGGIHAAATPEQRARVWECSHVGGHRFAPVTVSLPSGTVHGRLTVEEGVDVLSRLDERRVRPDRMRGRSCFPAPLQAADVAVREAASIDAEDALDALVVSGDRVVPVDLGWAVPMDSVEVEVRHHDGRAWRTVVRSARLAGERAESCGADPLPVHAWQADAPVPAAPWR